MSLSSLLFPHLPWNKHVNKFKKDDDVLIFASTLKIRKGYDFLCFRYFFSYVYECPQLGTVKIVEKDKRNEFD